MWPITVPIYFKTFLAFSLTQELWHCKYTQTQCWDNRTFSQHFFYSTPKHHSLLSVPIWMSTMPSWRSRVYVLLISIQHFQTNVYCMLMVLLKVRFFLYASTSCLQRFIKLFGPHWTMHFLHPGPSNKTVIRIFHKKDKNRTQEHKNGNPNTIWLPGYMMTF